MNTEPLDVVDMPEVRQAALGDAFGIYSLIKANADKLIVRSLGDIVRNIDRFFVIAVDGEIVACASYSVWPEPGNFEATMVELTSVAVRDDLRGRGIGARLISEVISRVAKFGVSFAVVLTYSPGFFAKIGFTEIPKTEIMHKIYAGCVNCTKQVDPFKCPEVAMGLRIKV